LDACLGRQAARTAPTMCSGTTTQHLVPAGSSPLAPTSTKSLLFRAAMPSEFSRYAQLGPLEHSGAALYKLLSGLAHATEWTRIPVSTRHKLERHESGHQRVLATAHLPTTARVTEIVVDLAEIAFEELERYGRPSG